MSILELIHSFYAVLTMLTLATLKLWWVIEEKFLEILYMGPSFFFFFNNATRKRQGKYNNESSRENIFDKRNYKQQKAKYIVTSKHTWPNIKEQIKLIN